LVKRYFDFSHIFASQLSLALSEFAQKHICAALIQQEIMAVHVCADLID
jgi:hypothetical protein